MKGYAFTYPLFSWLGRCTICAYVHYPTISSDMLSRVRSRYTDVNNRAAIANNWARSVAKLIYYNLFAKLYQFVGGFSSINIVNSSWTHNHVTAIWKNPKATSIVAPPCDTANLQRLSLAGRLPHIISVAQFRPEKNHALQGTSTPPSPQGTSTHPPPLNHRTQYFSSRV